MSNPSLIKNFSAGGAINPARLVKLSAAETVVLSAAATDLFIGVSNEVGAASGERQDVILGGIAFVEAGAAVTIGSFVTSDAVGRAVAAAPAAGTNNRVLGMAIDAAAAAGDQIRVLINQCSLQG